MLSPELSQPVHKKPTTQHTQGTETRLGKWIRSFIDDSLTSTKLTKTHNSASASATLGLEKKLSHNLSQRLSTPSLNPSARIYKSIRLITSHSHHGSVWGNRPQLPNTWISFGGKNRPQLPTSTHTHLSRSHPLCGGLQLPRLKEPLPHAPSCFGV